MALTALQHSAARAAGCYGGEGGVVESMVRKEEAVRLTIELDSKIMNALDKVMLSTDASRATPPDVSTNFGRNIKFVLDLQLDPQNMDILIEHPPAIKNAQQFIDAWAGLTSFSNTENGISPTRSLWITRMSTVSARSAFMELGSPSESWTTCLEANLPARCLVRHGTPL